MQAAATVPSLAACVCLSLLTFSLLHPLVELFGYFLLVLLQLVFSSADLYRTV